MAFQSYVFDPLAFQNDAFQILESLTEYVYFKFGYINNPYWVEEPSDKKAHLPCGYFFKRKRVE